MAPLLDFSYFDMLPRSETQNRSQRRKFTSSSREEEHTDSGNESQSDHHTFERQTHLVENFLHNRKIVILHTNIEDTQVSSHASDKICGPKEGIELHNNDVVVMGRYLENDHNLLISYGKVCDIDQNLFTWRGTFIIKILKNADPLMKLIIKANGVLVSVDSDSEKQTRASKTPRTLIELEKLGTTLLFEQTTKCLRSDGTLTFYKAGGGKQKKKLMFDIKMSIFCFPMTIIIKESPLTFKKVSSGFQIVTEYKENLVLFISSNKDLDHFLTIPTNSLIFGELSISFLENRLTKEKIESLTPIKFEFQSVMLHLFSLTQVENMVAFLHKLPLCKSVCLTGSVPNLNIKQNAGLKSKRKKFSGKENERIGEKNLFQIIECCYGLNNLQSVQLINFHVQFNSLLKIVHLREVLDTFVATRDDFLLNIRNPLIKTGSGDVDRTLTFLILLTSQVTDTKVFSVNEITTGTIRLMGIVNLSMHFSKGNLNNLQMDLAAESNSSKELRELCSSWKLRNSKNVTTQNFYLLHGGFNYTWMFQLNNLPTFGWLQIFTGIGNCWFNRDTLIETTAMLSGIIAADIPRNLAIQEVVINITLSDSRSEMEELVSSFCETFQNLGIEIKSLRMQVEADDSGWSLLRFTLTSRKIVVVTNDVHIVFPFNSTKDPRVVAIEVHTIPKELVQHVNEQYGVGDCELSPLVCIDQLKESPFIQPVSVLFRYPKKKESFHTSVYSKHPPETVDWDLVHDYEIILLQNERYLLYQSYEFSPVISAFGTENSRITPIEHVNQYFANCAFVTILSLEHRIGNVVFDCLQEKNESEMKQLKLSRFFEKRKVGKMKSSQELFASLGKNLTVAEPELENGERLHFFCPDNVKNEQEYTMKKVDVGGSWRGYVHYFLKTEEKEEKLFHMCYQVPNEPVATLSMKDLTNNHLRVEENVTDQKRIYVEKALYKLCRDMQNPIPICTYLISEFEMTTLKAEEIRSQKTKHERNLELVNHVLERGSTAYDKFRQALIEVEEPEHLIQLLPDFEKAPSQTDVDEPSESLLSLQIGEEIGASGSG